MEVDSAAVSVAIIVDTSRLNQKYLSTLVDKYLRPCLGHIKEGDGTVTEYTLVLAGNKQPYQTFMSRTHPTTSDSRALLEFIKNVSCHGSGFGVSYASALAKVRHMLSIQASKRKHCIILGSSPPCGYPVEVPGDPMQKQDVYQVRNDCISRVTEEFFRLQKVLGETQ